MSVLGSLIGVNCAECRRRGHYCQAQIWMDGEGEDLAGGKLEFKTPLCLRCADGEVCVFEAVRAESAPAFQDEVDACLVPDLTEQDWVFVAKLGKPRSVHAHEKGYKCLLDDKTRQALIADLQTMGTAEAAEKYRLPAKYVSNFRGNHRQKLALIFKSRLTEPVAREIGGETVLMAPLACMGAEMLKTASVETSKAAKTRKIRTLRNQTRLQPGSLNETVVIAVREGYDDKRLVARWARADEIKVGVALSKMCMCGMLRKVGWRHDEGGRLAVYAVTMQM